MAELHFTGSEGELLPPLAIHSCAVSAGIRFAMLTAVGSAHLLGILMSAHARFR